MKSQGRLLKTFSKSQKRIPLTHFCTLEDGSSYESSNESISNYSVKERMQKLLWKLTTVSTKNPLTYNYLKSQQSVEEEIDRHIEGKHFVPIHQLSILIWWWSSFITVTYLFTFLIASIRIGFSVKKVPMEITGIDYFLLFADIVCLIDILLEFNTGYFVMYTREIILNRKEVSINYLKTYFFIDFFSSFPIDFIILTIGTSPKAYFISQVKYIIKLFRYKTFHKKFQVLIEQLFNIKKYIGVIISFIIITHLTSCLYNFWGTMSQSMNYYFNNTLSLHENTMANKTPFQQYIFGFSLTTSNLIGAGSGSIAPKDTAELLLFVVIMHVLYVYRAILMVFFIEEFIAQLCTVNQFLEMENQLEEYMHHKQLPWNIRKRFKDYHNYIFQGQYFPEKSLLSLLSEHLQAEIKFSQCRFVTNSNTFRKVPENLMGKILSKLQFEMFLPGDVITKAGAIGDCMYFILSGTVAVYTPMGREVCHLDDGDYFGETALLMKDLKRAATVVAVEITEVYRLDVKDFRENIANNKELLKYVETVATARMNQTILLEEHNVRINT